MYRLPFWQFQIFLVFFITFIVAFVSVFFCEQQQWNYLVVIKQLPKFLGFFYGLSCKSKSPLVFGKHTKPKPPPNTYATNHLTRLTSYQRSSHQLLLKDTNKTKLKNRRTLSSSLKSAVRVLLLNPTFV